MRFVAFHAIVVIPLMTLLSVGAAALIGSHARWIELRSTERRPAWLLIPLTVVAMDGANWMAAGRMAETCRWLRRAALALSRPGPRYRDYFGIADDVDYQPIPWRGGRFDAQALAEAVETGERARHVLDAWREKG